MALGIISKNLLSMSSNEAVEITTNFNQGFQLKTRKHEGAIITLLWRKKVRWQTDGNCYLQATIIGSFFFESWSRLRLTTSTCY